MKAMRITCLRICAAILAGLWLAGGSAWAGEAKNFSPLGLPKAQGQVEGTQCVEPVDVMRRRHMEFIRHQRDKTMHQGIRTSKHSLVGCIDCHVAPGTDIHSQEHFCRTCHSYTGVRIDCFECHASQPQAETAAAPPAAVAPQAPEAPAAGPAAEPRPAVDAPPDIAPEAVPAPQAAPGGQP